MPTTYGGATIPVATDLADGPEAFRDYTDSFASIDAMEAAAVPIGTVLFTCRTVAPIGYLLLNGVTVAAGQTLYPLLWDVIPATWKSGVDIVLPNAQGRMPVAFNSADTSFDVVGETGGAKTATIAATNLPPHAHTQGGTFTSANNNNDHVHAGNFVTSSAGGGIYAPGLAGSILGFTPNQNVDHTHTTTLSGNTGNGPGTSAALSILPPYIAFPLMIRAA